MTIRVGSAIVLALALTVATWPAVTLGQHALPVYGRQVIAWHPSGIAVDRHGNVYVTDSVAGRVRKLSPAGQALATWGARGKRARLFLHPFGVAVSPSGKLLRRWGRFGRGAGQFDGPAAVALDSHGHVYVADFGNHRVEKFTSDGRLLAV